MTPTGTAYYNEAHTAGPGDHLESRGIPNSQSAASALSDLPLKAAAVPSNCDPEYETDVDGVHTLKRRVGLVSGVALIVGTMIGSGIFVSPKGVLERSGSVGLSLVVWGGCGVLSLLGALCYAELGTMITKSGAEYSYLLEAFGPLPAFLFSWVSVFVLKPSMIAIICLSLAEYIVEPLFLGCPSNDLLLKLLTVFSVGALSYAELGTVIPMSGGEYAYLKNAFGPLGPVGNLPAFMYAWTYALLLKPSGLSVITLSLAEYLSVAIFAPCNSPMVLKKFLAIFAIFTITFVNCMSVKLATRTQNIFTAAKLVAIAIIIVGGMYKLIQGHTQYLSSGFQGSTTSFSDIATAFYSGLWAYDGWNNLNYVTEELLDPYVNLPRAIAIGIPLVTVCYVLVNVAYMTVMSASELLASEAVAVRFASHVLGPVASIIPIFVAASTYGAGNGSCFTAGRLAFVAAREGHLVDILSYVHVKRFTPSPALIFNAFLAICMVIPGNIGSLIDFFSFTAWLFYGATMLALIVLRWTKKDVPRPYKVPLVIPIVVLIISVYLVIAPIIQNPQIEYFYASLFIISGLIFYVPFVHYKMQLPFMDKLTLFLQLLLQVAPTHYMPD